MVLPVHVESTVHKDEVAGTTTAVPAGSSTKSNQLITRKKLDDF